ncbi:MAG: hypothetical protein V1733_01180 [bacterium]
MNIETAFDRFLHEQAASGKQRIGIGILHPDEAIVESLTRATEFCEVTVFGKAISKVPFIHTKTPEQALVTALKLREVDAIVRGQATATVLRSELVCQFGYPPDIIKDLGVVKDNLGRVFIPLAISNAQGWTVDQKIILIEEAIELLGLLNLPVKVGVTSGVRPETLGKNQTLDQTHRDAETIVNLLRKDFQIENYFIEIEKAIADQCTILVFANGMVGNHVLRSLVFLGQVKIYGGIISGIDQLVVESFRNAPGFYEYLEFANALANIKKGKKL